MQKWGVQGQVFFMKNVEKPSISWNTIKTSKFQEDPKNIRQIGSLPHVGVSKNNTYLKPPAPSVYI